MIKITEVKLNPQKVYQKERFFIQVKVENDKKALLKMPFKISSKLGGGIINGNSKN